MTRLRMGRRYQGRTPTRLATLATRPLTQGAGKKSTQDERAPSVHATVSAAAPINLEGGKENPRPAAPFQGAAGRGYALFQYNE